MTAELTTQEWYEHLVEELKATLTEAIFNSRWALVEGYWTSGRLIREAWKLHYEDENPVNVTQLLQALAVSISKSYRTLWYALSAFDTYHDIQRLPEGKNITWNKLITKYLTAPTPIETPPLPTTIEGKYNVIYADPPWNVEAGPDWGSGEASEGLMYPSMDTNTIMNLKDKNEKPITDILAEDAHLYLWTINKYIPEAYAIARAWGFEPSTLLTWVKPPHGIGLGGTFVQTTEHLLFCRKGILEAKKRIDTTWFQYPRGRHSEKPQEFRKMIEEVSPGKRIELFARKKSEGWDVWGNEV